MYYKAVVHRSTSVILDHLRREFNAEMNAKMLGIESITLGNIA